MELNLSNIQINQLLNSDDESTCINILVLGMQKEDNAPYIISAINKLLTTNSTKEKGLNYLTKVLKYCSKSILNENALYWLNMCFGNNPKEFLITYRMQVLVKLIESCGDILEFNKAIVTNYISKIIDTCLKTQVQMCKSADILDCIKICLQKYSNPCSPFYNQLEMFLLKYLDKQLPPEIIQKAGACLHLLQQVGGGGIEGERHTKNWANLLHKLCATIHELYNVFLKYYPGNEDRFTLPYESLTFPELSPTLQDNQVLHIYFIRLTNCLVFLKTMMENTFKVPKSANLHVLLYIIERGLSYHNCILKIGVSIITSQFSVLLTKMQLHLLYILRSIIACWKQKLLPYSSVVSKIFVDCINRMQNCICFATDKYFYKCFHQVLNYWLTIVKSGINEIYQTKILNFLIQNIQPQVNKMSLNINLENKKSKKSRNKDIQEEIVAKSSKHLLLAGRSNLEQHKEDQCIYALDTLSYFFRYVFLNVKPELIKITHEIIIKNLIDIECGKIQLPYKNSTCQVKLYQVLISLYEQPYSVTPPLKLSIQLFSNGQNNSNIKIQTVCKKGLDLLEKISQPVYPSLYMYQNIEHFNITESVINSINIETIDNDVEMSNDNENDKTTKTNDLSDCTPSEISPPKKINILDVHILNVPINNATDKCASFNNTSNSDDDDGGNIKLALSPESIYDEVNEKNNEEMLLAQENLSHSNEKLNFVEETVKEENENFSANNLEIKEVFVEPPNKKSKNEDVVELSENEEWKSMKDAFVDILNDF